MLPFDTQAARRYADLAVKARAAGKGFPTPDGYIAAIAAAHEFAVASRDTSAFKAAGLTVPSRPSSGRKGRWSHFPRADVPPRRVSRPALLAFAGKQFVELLQLLRQSGRRAL